MQQMFIVQDTSGLPVANALLQATSPNGDWQALTDVNGQFTADLAAGPYEVTASRDGIITNPQPLMVGPCTIVLQPPTTAPPEPSVGDAIDLSKAVITSGSPDVRAWPIGTTLLELGFSFTDNMSIDFGKRYGPGAWPFVEGPEGGDIQYTLWVGCLIGGLWHFCGAILCISRGIDDNYVPTGPTLEPGQLPKNWYYFAGSPLATYQPQPGEQVAWFLTSGVQRRNDFHEIQERTQVVLAPFSEGVYGF
jgi:hypothetical protein